MRMSPSLAPAAAPPRRGAVLLTALLVFGFARALPPFQLFETGSGIFLHLHLLMELFAVVVATLVVIMAWHTMDPLYARVSNLLIAGFTLVGGCDLMHALTYKGMPALLGPGSTTTAIIFWLAGRGFEVLTLALLALRLRLPGRPWHWQAAALALTALLAAGAGQWTGVLPAVYDDASGVTAFKTHVEYTLCALYLLLGFWFHRLARTETQPRSSLIALSCMLMGLTELMTSFYLRPSDFSNIFAHGVKVLAYVLMFRATFRVSVTVPFDMLRTSRNALKLQQEEVESILDHVKGGIMRINPELCIVFINETLRRYLGVAAPVPALPLAQALALVPRQHAEIVTCVKRALAGEELELEMAVDAGAMPRHLAISLAPQHADDGGIIGCVLLAVDVTASRLTRCQLEKSLRDLSELSAALDAHAIVAVTDARGVIQRVNDKFCAISQYGREELIGRTHAIINSGAHPPRFFHDLWRTIGSGQVWSGEICNRARNGGLYWVYTTIVPFVGSDGVPVQYIAIRADITARKLIEQETETLAFYDALTGLPNRRLLANQLERSQLDSQGSGQYCGLVFLDLNDFKWVNDLHGHGMGDRLLRSVAQQLQAALRAGDTVARFGGDEFVMLLTGLGLDMAAAGKALQAMITRIMEDVGQERTIDGVTVRCSLSAGVVLYRGTDAAGEELLRQADIALYKAKDSDSGRCRFFDPQLQVALMREARLTACLRHAAEGGQLRLFYQPVVDRHGSAVGVEALIRWVHPELGMISPGEFIPLAEKSGQIIDIGLWVLETACRQLVAWRAADDTAALTIAVNVSPSQLNHAGFVDQVQRTLHASGAKPNLLKLEITESMLLHNVHETINRMQSLRQLGLRFSLDDFGTGYSSLSYLQRLPLAQLKIDQAFVRHMMENANNAAIVRTIVSLAAAMKLDVVAEGVETAAQYELLSSLGCRNFQGYLFARPLPVEQLRPWLQSRALLAQ